MTLFSTYNKAFHAAAGLLVLGLTAFADYPERPIKVIVPTDPGGSIDTVARTLARVIGENDWLSEKMVVVNQPGAGGTIATRRIKDAPNDGYTIGLWHQGLMTSKAMGIVDYDHTAFEILCSSGYSEVGIGTGPKSRIKTYDDLLTESKRSPIKFSTNIGLPVHLAPMIFANESGVSFRFIQAGGASQRLASVMGSHTELSVFSSLDFSNFKEAGIRPLVFFTEERVDIFPNTPTALEKGIDFQYQTQYFWITPRGVSSEILDTLEIALEKASEDPQTTSYFKTLGLISRFEQSEAIQTSLNKIRDRSAPIIEQMHSKR
ncbi:MAG: tripartite tricarboxylate transporter substrate binding protein [Opitutales bacterium]|nr:tripartite tricarboxylate transporter substrate binding protein [Opitutales bacterium]